MSRSKHRDAARRQERSRRISVRTVRRSSPDLHKLGRALIQIAMEQAAAEAAVAQDQRDRLTDEVRPEQPGA